MSWPTTRRYARSLSEAFPDVRARAVEHYRPPMGRLGDFLRAVVLVACCIAIPWLAAQGLN